MAKLSKRSKLFVFLNTPLLLLAVFAFRKIYARLLFGSYSSDEVVMLEGPSKVVYVTSLLIVGNSPDFISIVLYFYIKYSLKTLVVPDNSSQDMNDHSDAHHQDVYIIPNKIVKSRDEGHLTGDDDTQDELSDTIRPASPQEAWSCEATSVSPSPSQKFNSKQEVAVALALEMHVSSALFDVFVPLLGLFSMNERLLMTIPVTIFMTSWWPMILAVRTHSILRKMVKDEVDDAFRKAQYAYYLCFNNH